ncbi:MAG: hypothetical protein E7256_06325 [Lachnospiraceae bacterium]|nr:hypothetical protein [Lachnospiraceae bacterium]
MNQLYEMLGRTYKLEFDTFIGGHSSIPYEKNLIVAHRKNIENLVVDEKTKASIFGIETYSSVYEGEEGKSKIVFSLDRI